MNLGESRRPTPSGEELSGYYVYDPEESASPSRGQEEFSGVTWRLTVVIHLMPHWNLEDSGRGEGGGG